MRSLYVSPALAQCSSSLFTLLLQESDFLWNWSFFHLGFPGQIHQIYFFTVSFHLQHAWSDSYNKLCGSLSFLLFFCSPRFCLNCIAIPVKKIFHFPAHPQGQMASLTVVYSSRLSLALHQLATFSRLLDFLSLKTTFLQSFLHFHLLHTETILGITQI